MNRLERLINLLAALIDTERALTREDIRERIEGYPPKDESFRRQFERDKDTLRSMGVPIVVEAISDSEPHLGTGYRVHRADYDLPDPGLDPEETAALHLAASSVAFLDDRARMAVLKLGGVTGGDTPGPGRPSEYGGGGSSRPGVEVSGAEHLETLFGAIHDGRRTAFSYAGESRRVIPARLAFRNGHWYLSAWDEVRAGERVFRLDRISGDVEVGDPAKPPAEAGPGRPTALPAQPWELGDNEPTEARLWVDAEQADQAIRLAGPEVPAERRKDGSVVLSFQVRNPSGFRGFVLDLLDHAEVLSPPELRDDVVSWLEAIAR